jgi:hypothetical protein
MPQLHVSTTVMLLEDQHAPLYRVCFHGAKFPNCIFEFELPIITRFFLDIFGSRNIAATCILARETSKLFTELGLVALLTKDLNKTLHFDSSIVQPYFSTDCLESNNPLTMFINLLFSERRFLRLVIVLCLL